VKVLLITLAAALPPPPPAPAAQAGTPWAVPPPVPAPADAPTRRKDPTGRICKTSPVIGTRVPSRTCMTRAEWEERARTDRQDLEASQRGGLASCGTNPCS